tara:strand:+ start:166 stop:690 length:525 start_codon:yes stop_codon:yes gene_type:complete
MKNSKILSLLFLTFFFASCASVDVERNETDIKAEKDAAHGRTIVTPDSGSFLDDLIDDFNLPGTGGTVFGFGGSITFGAALTKVNFMPLASVDSDAGIIITEWYNISNDENRIKINIQVLNDEMMDNSISVQLFQQNFDGAKWVDQGNDSTTADKIKFSILEEARLLKTTADLS